MSQLRYRARAGRRYAYVVVFALSQAAAHSYGRAAGRDSAVTASIPTRPHTRWKPLRVYRYCTDLGTTVSTAYGYRASCDDCPWLGPVRRTVQEVRLDVRYHVCGDPPGTEAA